MEKETSPHSLIPTTPSRWIDDRSKSDPTETEIEEQACMAPVGLVGRSDFEPVGSCGSLMDAVAQVEEGKNEDVNGMSEAYGNKKPSPEKKKRGQRPKIKLDDTFESTPKTPQLAKERRVIPRRKYVRKNKPNGPSVLQDVAIKEQLAGLATVEADVDVALEEQLPSELDVVIDDQPLVEVNVAKPVRHFLDFDQEVTSDNRLIQVAESSSIYTPLLRACRGAMQLRCQCYLCRIDKIKPAFPKEYKKIRTSIRLALARRRMLLPAGMKRRVEDSFKCTLALARSFIPTRKKRKRRTKKAFVQGMNLGIFDSPNAAVPNGFVQGMNLGIFDSPNEAVPNGLNHSIEGKKQKATKKKATKNGKKNNDSVNKEAKDIMGDASQDEMVDFMIPNALVPYKDKSLIPNALVPYKKKSKARLEVDLDPETMRIWHLLKDREDISDPIEEEDEVKRKWWEKERGIFCANAVFFVRLIRLILGDRTFSQWKGSVVDSVVGVFLTQNVTDKLSSSAFMSLVARYPVNLPSEDTRIGRTEDFLSIELHSNEIKHDVSDKAGENVSFTGTSTAPQQHMNPPNSTNVIHVNDQTPERKPKEKGEGKEDIIIDWDTLRTTYSKENVGKQRSPDTLDSVDWDAVRMADVDEIAKTIAERGQHNILAHNIKDFLNRTVKDHGSIDLEWLRDVPPHKAKEYLLDIHGLGLKSVECLRLLTLHHHAFPVDVNVGRIAIRLGWVPLREPLEESLQIHLLENYPLMDKIQAYLWPRLCHLDQKTLYELHYMLITFGKVFCTKRKPSCTTCPLRGECKHYKSACASGKPALPGSNQKSDKKASTETSVEPSLLGLAPMDNPLIVPLSLEAHYFEPIIEEPPSPERVIEQDIEDLCSEDADEIPDIEDLCSEDPEEIPFINLCDPRLTQYMDQNEEENVSNALVTLSPQAASNPVPKLKMLARLRTEHQVYELPDFHPLLTKIENREPDDPSPYLLAIWTQDKSKNNCQPPQNSECQEQEDHQTVPGTLLIPCRSAMRGRFPLNGTYFQVNEVFADDESSKRPINVPRAWLWRLTKRTLYCGHSTTAIARDVPVGQLQNCFNEGFICVRGFNMRTRAPKQLSSRFHPPVKGKQKKFEE